MILSTPTDIRRALTRFRRVAVLGAHKSASKAAHYVPRYFQGAGYAVFPVNPVFAGETLFGREVVATLSEVTEPVEILNVFRRSAHLAAHLPEILALEPIPKLVWLQLGIRDQAFAAALGRAGIDLVEDRCMMSDHQRLL